MNIPEGFDKKDYYFLWMFKFITKNYKLNSDLIEIGEFIGKEIGFEKVNQFADQVRSQNES